MHTEERKSTARSAKPHRTLCIMQIKRLFYSSVTLSAADVTVLNSNVLDFYSAGFFLFSTYAATITLASNSYKNKQTHSASL